MPVRLYGGAAELFVAEDRELFIVGGARTGKSNGALTKAKFVAHTYPGSRQLFVRMTRKSLSESILPDWENKILGREHPAIGRARRTNRPAYYFPNGSDVVLGGLDDPEGFLSAEFDRIYVFQAEKLPDQKPWDTLLTRLSGAATPYCQILGDINPGSDRSWVLKRARSLVCFACGVVQDDQKAVQCQKCARENLGRVKWIDSRHQDNPRWFNHATGEWTPEGREYLIGTLGRTRGLQRARLLEHKWVSEEGLILEEFDPAVHMLGGELKNDSSRGWLLHVRHEAWSEDSKDPMRRTPVPIDWFGAGYDWGFDPDPGALQVWAHDRYGRRFLVFECGRLKWQIDQWAQLAEDLWKEFRFRYIACDPSMPAIIDAFNRRLTPFTGRGAPAIAIGADNRVRSKKDDMVLAGIDLMRWGLRDPKGVVRTFLLRDAARDGVDPQLREEGRPCSAEEEIGSWVFGTKKSTGEVTEKPSEDCDDHFVAAWRYEAGEGWGKGRGEKLGAVQQYPEKSLGAVLNHAKKLERARAKDLR